MSGSPQRLVELLRSAEPSVRVSALQYLARHREFAARPEIQGAIDECLRLDDVAVRFWANKLRPRGSGGVPAAGPSLSPRSTGSERSEVESAPSLPGGARDASTAERGDAAASRVAGAASAGEAGGSPAALQGADSPAGPTATMGDRSSLPSGMRREMSDSRSAAGPSSGWPADQPVVPAAAPDGAETAAAGAGSWPAPPTELLVRLETAPAGIAALDLFKSLLATRHPAVRAPLLRHLARCEDPVQMSFLVKNLGLAFPDESMLSEIAIYLQHADDRVVANAIEGIESIASPAAVAVFAQVLDHRSQRVRANAAKALARHDPARARQVIGRMLQMDDRPNFVIAGCHAVRQLKDPSFLPRLAPLVRHPLVGADALQAVSAICGQLAVEVLDATPAIAGDPLLRQRLLAAIEDNLAQRQTTPLNPWGPIAGGEQPRTIEVLERRLYALEPRLSYEEAQTRANGAKLNAFGLISKFLYWPTDEKVRLVYGEVRYEPFWHVVCHLRLDYTRTRLLDVAFEPPVQEVRIAREIRAIENGRLQLHLDEHCVETFQREVFVDAQEGNKVDFSRHISGVRREIPETEALMNDDTIVVPARIKASPIIRELLGGFMTPIKATEINQERVTIQHLDLYFRPVYAFEFQWEEKKQTAVLEIDGVTGDLISGRTFKRKFDELFSEATLFEIGGEAIELVVPGGALATRLVRAMLGKP